MRKKFKAFPRPAKLMGLVEFFEPARVGARALAKILRTHGYEPLPANIKALRLALDELSQKRSIKSTKLYEWKKIVDRRRPGRNLMGVLSTKSMAERLKQRQVNREYNIAKDLPHVNGITLKTSPDSIGVERTSGRYYTLTVDPDWRNSVYAKGMAVAERNFMLMAEHITTHSDGVEIYRVLFWRPTSQNTDEIQKGWAARIDWSEGHNRDVICVYGKTPTTVHSNMQRKLGKKAGQILTRGLDDDDN
jgi:hypothetical protein